MTREECVKTIIKNLNCSLNTAEFIMEWIDPYIFELQKENKQRIEELEGRIKDAIYCLPTAPMTALKALTQELP